MRWAVRFGSAESTTHDVRESILTRFCRAVLFCWTRGGVAVDWEPRLRDDEARAEAAAAAAGRASNTSALSPSACEFLVRKLRVLPRGGSSISDSAPRAFRRRRPAEAETAADGDGGMEMRPGLGGEVRSMTATVRPVSRTRSVRCALAAATAEEGDEAPNAGRLRDASRAAGLGATRVGEDSTAGAAAGGAAVAAVAAAAGAAAAAATASLASCTLGAASLLSSLNATSASPPASPSAADGPAVSSVGLCACLWSSPLVRARLNGRSSTCACSSSSALSASAEPACERLERRLSPPSAVAAAAHALSWVVAAAPAPRL